MSVNHVLHYKPGAEGYGAWRLECIEAEGTHHGSFIERSWPDENTCRCTEEANDCEYCTNGDHGGCGFYGTLIYDIGYECRTEPSDECWTGGWLNEIVGECIHGDDWPENGPWSVDCRWVDECMEIHHVPDDAPIQAAS